MHGTDAAFQVSIYDLEHGYWVKSFALGHDVAQSSMLVHLAFSADSKRLLVQAGGPDWVLTCWAWATGKLLSWSRHLPITYSGQASADNRVTQVSVNPWKPEIFASTGPRAVNLWRSLEKDRALRGVSLVSVHRDDVEYTEHVWLQAERLAVATSSGEILVFDRLLSNVKRINSGDWVLTGLIPAVPGKTILSMMRTHRGFVTSTSDGVLLFFEQQGQKLEDADGAEPKSGGGGGGDDEEDLNARANKRHPYVLHQTVEAAPGTSIRSLSLPPGNATLACLVGTAHIGMAHMATLMLSKAAGDRAMEIASRGFHAGAVLGLDMCAHLPVAVTVGEDRFVRLWNYQDRTCRLSKTLLAPLTGVAIHPSGPQLLLGASDRLRMYHILADDLALLAEFPIRSCELIRYSHGGSMFAAVDRTVIYVYSSVTFAVRVAFKGHTASIRSLCWSNNDLCIASAGTEGAVYEWRIDTLARDRTKEHVLKNCKYAAIAISAEGAMVAAGNDAFIRRFVDGTCDLEVPTGVNITSLKFVHAGSLLLAGTEAGALRAYSWPPAVVGGTVAYQEVRLHQGALTHIAASPTGRVVMTASDDGSVFVCDVNLPERPRGHPMAGIIMAESEIVLYLKVRPHSGAYPGRCTHGYR